MEEKHEQKKICLIFYQAQTTLSRLLPAGMLISVMTEEKGWVLAGNRERREAGKWKACLSSHVAIPALDVWPLNVLREKCEQKSSHSLGCDWRTGLAQAARAEKPKAAAHNGSHKDKPGEEQHNQGVRRWDTSLWQLQPTQKKCIWGYFLHRHWREARLHTPVPWLATKLHCRQTKLVNHKAAQKKRVRDPVLVLASSVS